MVGKVLRKTFKQDNEVVIVMPRAVKPSLEGRPKPAPRPQARKHA